MTTALRATSSILAFPRRTAIRSSSISARPTKRFLSRATPRCSTRRSATSYRGCLRCAYRRQQRLQRPLEPTLSMCRAAARAWTLIVRGSPTTSCAFSAPGRQLPCYEDPPASLRAVAFSLVSARQRRDECADPHYQGMSSSTVIRVEKLDPSLMAFVEVQCDVLGSEVQVQVTLGGEPYGQAARVRDAGTILPIGRHRCFHAF